MEKRATLDVDAGVPRAGVFVVGSVPLAGTFLLLAVAYGPQDSGFWPCLALGAFFAASAAYLHRRLIKRRGASTS